MTKKALFPVIKRPATVFGRKELDWKPWLPPIPEEEITPRHLQAFIHRSRIKSPYFRLLSLDPEILEARTNSDEGIFHSPGGLPRGERELAAAVVSRLNGCLYCAAIHAGFAAAFSRRAEDVERLLDEGPGAELGGRWNAIAAAAAALASVPSRFGPGQLSRLRREGLSDPEILDIVHSVAFFGWANRLMLSLGQPEEFPIGVSEPADG
jgi:alkylhydroperoxidase domain protein